MFRNMLMALASLLVIAPAFAAEQSHSAKGVKEVVVTAINATTEIEFWDRNTIEVEVPDDNWPDTVVVQQRGTALEISTAGENGAVDVHVKDCVGDDCTESGTGPRAIFMHEGTQDPIVLDLEGLADGDQPVFVEKIGDEEGAVIIEKKTEDGKTVIIKRRVHKGDDVDVDMDVELDEDHMVEHGGKRVIVLHDEDDHRVHKDGDHRKEVRVKVKMKRHGDLDEVKSLMVRMPRDLAVFANTINGPLTVGNGKGDARVGTVNGPLKVPRYDGELSARTVAGPLEVGDVEGRLNASTVSGHLTIRGAEEDVRARTVSGPILYEGDLPRSGTCSMSTTSGTVEFKIPRNSSFNYDIDTFSGRVTGKSFQIPSNTGRVVGTVGNASAKSPSVKVETVSGQVSFQEK